MTLTPKAKQLIEEGADTIAMLHAKKEWWSEVCRQGDPLHRWPKLIDEAFKVGFLCRPKDGASPE